MFAFKGVIYTISDHALDRMAIRKISVEMLQQAMTNPDAVEYDERRDNYRYDKELRRQGLLIPLRVVVDENFHEIITIIDLAE